MMFRLYKMRIKCLCRNYDTIFWSFGFPLLLAVFFYMGFGNLAQSDNINSIPVAVVSEENSSSELVRVMKAVEITEGKKLFLVHSQTLSKAREMLFNEEIDGYVVEKEEPVLYINDNGIRQSVMKAFIDSYLHLSHTVNNIETMDQKAINNNFNGVLNDYKDYVVNGSDRERNPDFTLIYFYTVIALTCMFGSNWGFREMVDIQANQSILAARINVSPIHKMRLMACNLLAAFTLHYISILFLLLFLNKVLGVEFGNRIGMILITSMIGSLCGITLGAMVCVVVKANDKVRSAILNVVVIGGGFLSGMVIADMKYIIAVHAPIIAYINPSSLITDAFYCLYYYDSYQRLYRNLLILSLITIVFAAVTYHEIRRKEYASI